MPTENFFRVADYVIFVITILVSLGIGLYYALSGGRQRTTSEYLVGNRRMGVLPVAISLMVSFESSIMMLGVPAEIYRFGIQWVIGKFGYFFAHLLAVKIMVPLIYPLKLTSANEYLELRFKSHSIRLLATLVGMIGYVFYMGIVLFGPAIALEAVTGFPLYSSILVVALVAMVYTAVGGIKAVIWTDVFQSFIMFAGVFAVLIKGTMAIGGVTKTWEIANDNGRLNFFNFDPNPMVRHTFWTLFVGSLVRGLSLIFNQSSIQRISSTASLKDAQRVMLFTAPAFLFTLSFAAVEGIVAYAYYDTIRCDPLESKQIRNSNQIIPYMVMDIFNGLPGMPGLFLASLFSASLSTLSSGLSSLSALLWQDFVKPHTKPMSEFKATVIAKCSVVFFGTSSIAVAFMVSYIGGTLIQIAGTILSSFSGPLTGLFFLGCFCPWANAKGAIISCLTGVAFVFWIAAGMTMSSGVKRTPPLPAAPIDQCLSDTLLNSTMLNTTNIYENMTMWTSTTMDPVQVVAEPEGLNKLYSISYLLLGVIGQFYVVIFGSIISFMTGYEKPEDSDPRYLVPLTDELLFFLPESIRKPLRFGYSYDKSKVYDDEKKLKDIKDDNYHLPARVTLTVETPKETENGITIVSGTENNHKEENGTYDESRVPLTGN